VSQAPSKLSAEQLTALQQFDTCKLANAIERLNLRLHNEGYTQPGLRCVTGACEPVLGFAATSRVRCGDPPLRGSSFHDVADWWAYLKEQPVPKIAVIEDVDPRPAQGAVVSNVHAEVLRALGCAGAVTNGAVRDIPALTVMNFPAFASQVTISHAYVHLVEYGKPVDIHGLKINPGDLLYADVHGVLSLPVGQIPDVIRLAHEAARHEARVIDLCRSPEFSLERLYAETHNLEITR
jgi:4-hydroxy-4-methyl-2-oxoglutarate aldolase